MPGRRSERIKVMQTLVGLAEGPGNRAPGVDLWLPLAMAMHMAVAALLVSVDPQLFLSGGGMIAHLPSLLGRRNRCPRGWAMALAAGNPVLIGLLLGTLRGHCIVLRVQFVSQAGATSVPLTLKVLDGCSVQQQTEGARVLLRPRHLPMALCKVRMRDQGGAGAAASDAFAVGCAAGAHLGMWCSVAMMRGEDLPQTVAVEVEGSTTTTAEHAGLWPWPPRGCRGSLIVLCRRAAAMPRGLCDGFDGGHGASHRPGMGRARGHCPCGVQGAGRVRRRLQWLD